MDPGDALHEATRKGDVEAARRVLESNPSCVDTQRKTRTPLHNAAWYGFSDIASTLLEYKAEVDARSWTHTTPLIIAAEQGHLRVIMCLLAAGADINARTSTKALRDVFYTPLHKAASRDSCDTLLLLIAKGASITHTAKDGTTALHIAAKNGRRSNVIALVGFGCDPLSKDSNGKSAFDHADELPQPLKHDIKVAMSKWRYDGEKLTSLQGIKRSINKEGEADLYYLLVRALEVGDEATLEFAVELASAKTIDQRRSKGMAVLHHAAEKGNLRAVKLLLEKGASIHNHTRSSRLTALALAVLGGHEDVVRYLLESGATTSDVNAKVLGQAKERGHNGAVELIEKSARSQDTGNSSNSIGRSPSPFRMIRADKDVFSPQTDPAVRRVRIVQQPNTNYLGEGLKPGREPSRSPEPGKTEDNADTDSTLDVEGGFDGKLFSKPLPASGLTQPKTFDNLIKTWHNYFDFKESDKKIRVAVLDTGIDLGHEDWRRPRADMMNFCGGSESDIQDVDGHGTQVAGIILRLAPRADVYIARVCVENRNRGISGDEKTDASNTEKCPHPIAVAKAIDWALENDVNIINMSFGYKFAPKVVKEALYRARQKKVVVFAAMSNGGSFEPARWPARDGVCAIGIHSCDEYGTRSTFTAPPASNADNFMVVGENIVTHWPTAKGGGFRLDDGTSFATPVASAMAALTLAFAEQKICKAERNKAQEFIELEDLYENFGMSMLLRNVSVSEASPGFLFVHPDLLWKDLDIRVNKLREDWRAHAWDVIKKALDP
ncbi:ankyrin [Hypoxylon trugodes]|uniref:ankyrin n=1 Tax=Hypoxylon trugodes TaxID=326681 RepID=UPI00219EB122|nr:ankyrin [Hypoxylon trugodes]KAI1394275.1 ankyrin [Hypoxylon trugodes]